MPKRKVAQTSPKEQVKRPKMKEIKKELQKPKVIKGAKTKVLKIKKQDFQRRQSLRLKKLQPDGITPQPEAELPPTPTSWSKPRLQGEIPMVLSNEEPEDYKQLLTSLNIMSKTKSTVSIPELKEDSDYSRYKKTTLQLKVKENHIAKVVPSRIFSIEFCNIETKTILFAGDKRGHLGLWDISSEDSGNIYVYEPHTRPIAAMAIDPNNNKLFTCSYDGSIRSADFERSVFDEIFAIDEDETYLTYMAFCTPSSNTLIASTGDGHLNVVDYRTGSTANSCYKICDRKINCLDAHPLNKNILLTSSQKGAVALWDIRSIKGPNSYVGTFSLSRSISSSFFSPSTGRQILTTSLDNFISVYDVNDNKRPSSCCLFKHNNHTGRWLSTFHARWDPKTTSCFGVGSMAYPRQLDIFSSNYKSGALTHLQHDNFSTITSRIAFHPSKNIIAGANSSGKVFLWS